MLASLVSIRTATRSSKPALAALAPPSMLQRKSLVWLRLLALLSYAWTHWLPVLVARRMEVVRAGRKLGSSGVARRASSLAEASGLPAKAKQLLSFCTRRVRHSPQARALARRAAP